MPGACGAYHSVSSQAATLAAVAAQGWKSCRLIGSIKWLSTSRDTESGIPESRMRERQRLEMEGE